ncbi:MAG: hypothetical protein AAF670_10940 [Planctomycetota bacterium]
MADRSDDAPAKTGPKPANRWLLAAVGGLTLVTMGGMASVMMAWIQGNNIDAHRMLRLASSQYVDGNVIVAGDLAAQAVLDPETEEDAPWRSLRHFLMGAGAFAKADLKVSPRDRREAMLEVLEPLQRSLEAGFPEGRFAEGHRLLGLAQHYAGLHDKAIVNLEFAADGDLTRRNELLPKLAQSQADNTSIGAPPTDAIETIDEYLLDSSLSLADQAQAKLLRIDWLIRARRRDEASATLDQTQGLINEALEAHESWALEINDQVKLRQSQQTLFAVIDELEQPPGTIQISDTPVGLTDQIAAEDVTRLRSALKSLSTLEREAPPRIAADARLAAGRCYLLLDEPDEALATLSQLRQQRPFADAGMEGGLSELELLAHQARGPEVVQTARVLIREISQSRHLSLDPEQQRSVGGRIVSSLAQLRMQDQCQHAIETAQAATPILTPAVSLEQQGIAYRDWANRTLDTGRTSGGDIPDDVSALARLRFRGAGDALADAAHLRFTTNEYLPTLWNAIEALQEGRHYQRSIGLLRSYLRYEERSRQPRGLVALGRALLAEGQTEEAIDALRTCMVEFERDPLRYDARLMAAQAAAEQGDVDQSETWLRDNLTDGKLAPQSPPWRNSLFFLGEMLYGQSNIASLRAAKLDGNERVDALKAAEPKMVEANRRLNEAKLRYWPSVDSQDAAYRLARTQRLLSELPSTEMGLPNLSDSVRRELRTKANEYRQASLDEFQSLVGFLDDQRRDNELSNKQEAILRNSLVASADLLMDMNRNEEAADTFRDIALRYMNEPPCLEGLLGQSRVLRKIRRDREADMLVRQANMVLDRIGSEFDDDFSRTTRYDRDGWRSYLTWMTKRIELADAS